MGNVHSSLQKADLYFNQFLAVPRNSEREQQLTKSTALSYERLYSSLRELIVFLEGGNVQGFMDQPTQKTQDLFEAEFVQYLLLVNESINQANAANMRSFTMAGWFMWSNSDADCGHCQRHVVAVQYAGPATECHA